MIEHNEENQTFYLGNEMPPKATMTYKVKEGKMIIDHTIVDKELRGQNIGIKLVKAGVEFARDNNLTIVPECTYAKKVLTESEEYKDVLG